MADDEFILPASCVLAKSKTEPGIVPGSKVITKDDDYEKPLVSQVQKILKELAYFDADEDGVFNDATKDALIAFQREHHDPDSSQSRAMLVDDGIVGPKTARALSVVLHDQGSRGVPIRGSAGRQTKRVLSYTIVKAVPIQVKKLFFTRSDSSGKHLSWDNILGFDDDLKSIGVTLEAEFVNPVSGLPPKEVKATLTRHPPKEGGGNTDKQSVTIAIPLTYRSDLSHDFVKYTNRKGEDITIDKLPIPAQVKPTLASVRRKKEPNETGGQSDQAFREGLGNDGFVNRGMAAEDVKGDEEKEIPEPKELFLSGGVEVLEIGIDSQPNVQDPQAVKAKILMQSPADILYYTGHGHSNLPDLVHGTPPGVLISLGNLDADTVKTNWKRTNCHIKTLIVAGCSVLGIHHLTTRHRFEDQTWDGVGMKWAELLPMKENLVDQMVGYWGAGPLDAKGGNDIAREMGNAMRTQSDPAQAWLDIHVKNHPEQGTVCALHDDVFIFLKDGKVTTNPIWNQQGSKTHETEPAQKDVYDRNTLP